MAGKLVMDSTNADLEQKILDAIGALVVPYRTICEILGDVSEGRIASTLGWMEHRGIIQRLGRGYQKVVGNVTPATPVSVASTTATDGQTKDVCGRCGVPLTEENWYPSLKKSRNNRCKDCHNNRLPVGHRQRKPDRSNAKATPAVTPKAKPARTAAAMVRVQPAAPVPVPAGVSAFDWQQFVEDLRRRRDAFGKAIDAIEEAFGPPRSG